MRMRDHRRVSSASATPPLLPSLASPRCSFRMLQVDSLNYNQGCASGCRRACLCFLFPQRDCSQPKPTPAMPLTIALPLVLNMESIQKSCLGRGRDCRSARRSETQEGGPAGEPGAVGWTPGRQTPGPACCLDLTWNYEGQGLATPQASPSPMPTQPLNIAT